MPFATGSFGEAGRMVLCEAANLAGFHVVFRILSFWRTLKTACDDFSKVGFSEEPFIVQLDNSSVVHVKNGRIKAFKE